MADQDMSPTVAENYEAMKTIGEEGGAESVALVASLMEQSHRHTEAIYSSLYEGEVAAHKRTKERLAEAEAQLSAVEQRVMRLLFAPPNEWELSYGE